MARCLYSCGIAACERSFQSAKQLKRHMKRHEKSYKCRLCPTAFSSSDERRRHEGSAIHSVGPKKHACRINGCFFTTNRSDTLSKHRNRIHPVAVEEQGRLGTMTSPSSTPASSSTPPPPNHIEWFNKAKIGDTATLQNLLDTNRVALEDLADDGSTALHCAASSGNEVGVAFLLQKGANLEANNKKRRTPLHEAILGKHHETVKHLLREGASLADLWMTSKCLVRSDSVDIFAACMEFLGPVTLRDNLKRVLLYEASKSRVRELLPVLLSPDSNQDSLPKDANATLQFFEGRDDLSWASLYGEKHQSSTPIHHAIANGNLDVVQLLVENGFRVDISSNNGLPLHVAAGLPNMAVLEYLLGLPSVQVDSVTPSSKQTPLHKAAMKGRVDAAKLILGHPATRLNAVDAQQKTALYYAAIAGHLEMVDFLLGQKHINLDAPKQTLLRHVAFRGHWPIVRTLLSYQSRQEGNKAATASSAAQIQVSLSQLVEELRRHPDFQDIDAVILFGEFLSTAITTKDIDLLQILLNHSEFDVLPNITDPGWTFLHHAVDHGHLASVQELLKDPRFDVNTPSCYITPLELAKLYRHSDIAALLIAHGAVDNETEPHSSTHNEHVSSSTSTLTLQNEEEKDTDHSFDQNMFSGVCSTLTLPNMEDNSLDHSLDEHDSSSRSLSESWCGSPEFAMEDVD